MHYSKLKRLDAIAGLSPPLAFKFRFYSDRLDSSYLNHAAERGTKSCICPLKVFNFTIPFQLEEAVDRSMCAVRHTEPSN